MAAPRPVRRRLLPQRPRRAPVVGGPQWRPEARVVTGDVTDPLARAARPRPRGGPRGGRPGPRAPDRRGRGGRHQVQRRRRRHRDRPRQRGADPRARAERRPDDGFLGEEGGTAAGTTGVRWVVDPIDGTVNFLYGLPQYAVSHRGRAATARWSSVSCVNAATGVEYARHAGGERPSRRPAASPCAGPAPAAPAAGDHRLRLRRGQARASRPRRSPGCCRGCATSAGWDRAPSTCATSPRAPPTATSRRACSPGTTPPARSSRPRRGARCELHRGRLRDPGPGRGSGARFRRAPGGRQGRRVPVTGGVTRSGA